MSNPYRRFTTFYQDASGSAPVAVLESGNNTLVTAKNANTTIFIQKIHIQVITGNAGSTWGFEDSTDVEVTGDVSVATGPQHIDYDFGPEGVPLTQGANFILEVTNAGATGVVSWEAYQKLTAVAAVSSAFPQQTDVAETVHNYYGVTEI